MKAGARNKVVLLDGTVTDTWSEGWRLECMKRNVHVQHIIANLIGRSMRTRREEFYASIRRHEGEESEKRVRAAVESLWVAEKKRLEKAP